MLVLAALLLLLLAGRARGYGVGFAKLFEDAPGEVADARLAVDGHLPAWLEGTLVRNGPGQFNFGKRQATVAFDGFAKLHRFRISGGQVVYSSRFLRSDSFNRTAKIQGDLAPMKTFGALDPCLSIFGKAQGLFAMNDNMLVNVVKVGESYLALSDAVGALEFDLDSLGTLGAPPGIPQGGGFPSVDGAGPFAPASRAGRSSAPVGGGSVPAIPLPPTASRPSGSWAAPNPSRTRAGRATLSSCFSGWACSRGARWSSIGSPPT